MNELIRKIESRAWEQVPRTNGLVRTEDFNQKFAELILQDMHRKVIASILITDVVMEEKGQVPTSEDYIRAIHKDFGVEE